MLRYLANTFGRKQAPEIAGSTSCILGFDNPEGRPGNYRGPFNTEKYFDFLRGHFAVEGKKPDIFYSDGRVHHTIHGGFVTAEDIDTIYPKGTLKCIGHEYIEDSFICEGCPFYRIHQKVPE